MPANAKMTDTQNGIKSMESKSMTEAKILSNISLYYRLYIKINRIDRNSYRVYNIWVSGSLKL